MFCHIDYIVKCVILMCFMIYCITAIVFFHITGVSVSDQHNIIVSLHRYAVCKLQKFQKLLALRIYSDRNVSHSLQRMS